MHQVHLLQCAQVEFEIHIVAVYFHCMQLNTLFLREILGYILYCIYLTPRETNCITFSIGCSIWYLSTAAYSYFSATSNTLLHARTNTNINSRNFKEHILYLTTFSLWVLAHEHTISAIAVLSIATDVNVKFPIGSTSDAIGRSCTLNMAHFQRLSIACHLVSLPALAGRGHLCL